MDLGILNVQLHFPPAFPPTKRMQLRVHEPSKTFNLHQVTQFEYIQLVGPTTAY